MKKNVILLGDSIRINYCERVKELLSDICDVRFPHDNCAYTLNTIWNVRNWVNEIGFDKIDLIHYNNGIWDHHRNLADGEPLSNIEQYVYLNRRLHNHLSTYTDKLIWATTTPSSLTRDYTKSALAGLPNEEWNREIALYNNVLSGYLTSKGVWITDLYSIIEADPETLCEDGIHLSDKGIEAAAQAVAENIRKRLEA